jgi:septum formation protein
MSARGLWRGPAPLLLASTSRVRRTLLEAVGLPVEAVAPGLDERAVEGSLAPGVTPGELASLLARRKAEIVATSAPDRVVIGADQVLDLDGECLGKPETPVGARRQIARLSGRSHVLHSAVAIATDGKVHTLALETARLTMRELDEPAVALYVEAAGEAATRSAGGYEIEGLGIHLFTRVDGEHSTILGLPLLPTLAALRDLNLLAL